MYNNTKNGTWSEEISGILPDEPEKEYEEKSSDPLETVVDVLGIVESIFELLF